MVFTTLSANQGAPMIAGSQIHQHRRMRGETRSSDVAGKTTRQSPAWVIQPRNVASQLGTLVTSQVRSGTSPGSGPMAAAAAPMAMKVRAATTSRRVRVIAPHLGSGGYGRPYLLHHPLQVFARQFLVDREADDPRPQARGGWEGAYGE